MKRKEKFDSFDINVGKYSSRKVPKWVCHHADLIEYLHIVEDEFFHHEEIFDEIFQAEIFQALENTVDPTPQFKPA
jgi:hypothetical protein